MGLSNGERFSKMIHSVAHIDDIRQKLQNRKCDRLAELADNLWHEMLGKKANGLFWFMGGELHSDHMGESGLIATAFECHKPDRPGVLRLDRDKKNDVYTYLDYYDTARKMTDLDYLLNLTGDNRGDVILLYMHTENIASAMCRYDDDFSNSYKGLNNLLRKIQGECFKIFRRDRTYAHGWMLAQLCDKLLTMDENDLVNKWWMKHNLHHGIRINNNSYNADFHLFRKYQFKDLSVQNRLDLTLALVGTYYHYTHQHKELLEMVNEYNKGKRKGKIDLGVLEKTLKKIPAAKEEADKSARDSRYCEFTGNYVDYNGEQSNCQYDERN